MRIGQSLSLRAIGHTQTQKKSAQGSKDIVELSLRPSVVSSPSPPSPLMTIRSLEVNQMLPGYIQTVGKRELHVHVAPHVQGQVYILDASSDLEVLKNFASHFKVGTCLTVRVVSVDHHKGARFSLLPPPPAPKKKRTRYNRQKEGKEEETKVEEGAVVAGQNRLGVVVKILPQSGLMVELAPEKVGRVHMTDIADFPAENPLAPFSVDSIVNVNVIEVGENQIDLSLRPSRVMPTEPKKGNEEGAAAAESLFPEIYAAVDVVPGQLINGYVKAANKAGCFIWLGRHITARAKVSHLSDDFLSEEQISEQFPAGKLVLARVLHVDAKAGLVELTLKPSRLQPPIEWNTLEVGTVVVGYVKSVQPYGAFISFHDSDVSGLLPKKEMAKTVEKGDKVSVKIINVDVDGKKVTFSTKGIKGGAGETASSSDKKNKKNKNKDSDDEDEDMDDEFGEALGGEKQARGADSFSFSSDDDVSRDEDSSDEEEEDKGGKKDKKNDSNNNKKGKVVEHTNESNDDSDDDDDEDSDDDEGQSKKKARTTTSATATTSASTGFEWDDFSTNNKAKNDNDDANSDSDSDDEDEADESRTKSRARREKKKSDRAEIAEIEAREKALMEGQEPETAEDFERLVVSSPNSSLIWLRYMAWNLGLGQIAAARAVAERALKVINFRQEVEKENIWIALMNLENAYGSRQSLMAVFDRACQFCDSKRMHIKLLDIFEKNKDEEVLTEFHKVLRKKFKSVKVMLRIAAGLNKLGHSDAISRCLNESVALLPRRKHVKLCQKFAILEFKQGSKERGRSIFEGIMGNFPKRADLWSVYVDQEESGGEVDKVRRLYDRILTMQLKPRQMRFFFKKYLAFEKSQGEEGRVQYVTDLARAYVEQKLT